MEDVQSEALVSLAQAKKARQESEEQAKLLANRIALLRQEEAKANKKIEDTRRRAREILEARIRNQEAQRRKEEERKAKQAVRIVDRPTHLTRSCLFPAVNSANAVR